MFIFLFLTIYNTIQEWYYNIEPREMKEGTTMTRTEMISAYTKAYQNQLSSTAEKRMQELEAEALPFHASASSAISARRESSARSSRLRLSTP